MRKTTFNEKTMIWLIGRTWNERSQMDFPPLFREFWRKLGHTAHSRTHGTGSKKMKRSQVKQLLAAAKAIAALTIEERVHLMFLFNIPVNDWFETILINEGFIVELLEKGGCISSVRSLDGTFERTRIEDPSQFDSTDRQNGQQAIHEVDDQNDMKNDESNSEQQGELGLGLHELSLCSPPLKDLPKHGISENQVLSAESQASSGVVDGDQILSSIPFQSAHISSPNGSQEIAENQVSADPKMTNVLACKEQTATATSSEEDYASSSSVTKTSDVSRKTEKRYQYGSFENKRIVIPSQQNQHDSTVFEHDQHNSQTDDIPNTDDRGEIHVKPSLHAKKKPEDRLDQLIPHGGHDDRSPPPENVQPPSKRFKESSSDVTSLRLKKWDTPWNVMLDQFHFHDVSSPSPTDGPTLKDREYQDELNESEGDQPVTFQQNESLRNDNTGLFIGKEDLNSVISIREMLTTQAVIVLMHQAVKLNNLQNQRKISLVRPDYVQCYNLHIDPKLERRPDEPEIFEYMFFAQNKANCIIPLIRDIHFAVLYFDMEKRTVVYVDSRNNFDFKDNEICYFARCLKMERPTITKWRLADNLKQPDDVSCGVFAVEFCTKFCQDGLNWRMEKVDVVAKRREFHRSLQIHCNELSLKVGRRSY